MDWSSPWWVLVTLSFVITLAITFVVDGLGHFRAKFRQGVPLWSECRDHRYAVLVPIYGNMRYLTNTDRLAPFAERIVLCTTDTESDEFYADLDAVSAEFGFRQLRVPVEREGAPIGSSGKRSTSAPIRDQVMEKAINLVTDEYVICIDADTIPLHDFAELVGAMSARNIDVASVSLTSTKQTNLLEIWQTFEYQVGMVLRRVWPWVLSGGCHAARTVCYREIMRNHSKYFQGNDVEVGILARKLNYKVAHVRFEAATDVPSTVRDWRRQRWAWSGGEFRLAIVNMFSLTFGFALYMSGFVYFLVPLRWWWILNYPSSLIFSGAAYFVLVFGLWLVHRRALGLGWKALALILYPLYSIVSSLILVTVSPISYVMMSMEFQNWGIIKLRPEVMEVELEPETSQATAEVASPEHA